MHNEGAQTSQEVKTVRGEEERRGYCMSSSCIFFPKSRSGSLITEDRKAQSVYSGGEKKTEPDPSLTPYSKTDFRGIRNLNAKTKPLQFLSENTEYLYNQEEERHQDMKNTNEYGKDFYMHQH
jgi:hypothetical protein